MLGRMQLLVVALAALAVVAVAWFAKTGIWQRRRLSILAAGVVAALLLLTRRIGWGELVAVGVVFFVPALLFGGARDDAGGRR